MRYFIFILSIIIFSLFIPHYAKNTLQRPTYEKLGYYPKGKFLKNVVGEFRWFLGEYFTFKAITYYGNKAPKLFKGKKVEIEHFNLYKTLETAVILNPYHEDAYYFTQAIFTWNVEKIKEVNSILKYVYKHRKWDFQLPFFLGFNHAYFLKDYKEAAKYFKEAAELANTPLFANLSARYFYESGNTKLGIIFLDYMLKNTRNKGIKKIYEKRLSALKAINLLEEAVNIYKKRYGKLPSNLKELLDKSILGEIPKDPYGGFFYIDKNGKIRTTSNLTKGHKANERNKN
ncbi:MAG: Uncharacterized protein XD41_0781 [Desulfonauticus sp. 38_4375]|nr:MAG: Uncharacterized protein XD41_0781 [Desulfonauticus sp. 38_4375]